MPDLGRYAVEVGLAYGVSLGLLIAIVWLSVAQSRRVREALKEAEEHWSDG
ncbi:MAG: heme exporter protein CcmD [Boseongicola sp.]|nr:MAG: heme exporter protein CcmD [Boseongicola sp.]